MKRAACILLFLLFCGNCYAGDPYEWTPAPQGIYLSAYPVYYSASKLTDRNGNTVTNDLKLRSYEGVLRLTYYNKTTFPNTWGFTVALPAGEVMLRNDKASGLGDLIAGVGYWLIDDQASNTFFLASMFVDFPTGNFNKNNNVNMGMNVYKYRPTIAFAKSIGKAHSELVLKYNIYTKEPNTGIKAGDEIIGECSAGYFVRPNLILGGMLNATAGKNMTVNGQAVHGTGIRRYQAGPSVLWIMSGRLNVTFDALREFGTRNTSEGYLLTSRITWKL